MKLVRDKISRLHAEGELGPHPSRPDRSHQAFRRATPKEYRLLLLTKLAEEVGEVLSAMTRAQLLEELGDLRAVIDAIEQYEDITFADTVKRQVKNEKFGGFRDGWILEWVPVPPLPADQWPEPKVGDHVYSRTLMTTIAGFDEDRGTRLNTGAWICASMLEYVGPNAWKIKKENT